MIAMRNGALICRPRSRSPRAARASASRKRSGRYFSSSVTVAMQPLQRSVGSGARRQRRRAGAMNSSTLPHRHCRLLGARVVAVLAGEPVLDQVREHGAQVLGGEAARDDAAASSRRASRSARAASIASPPSPATALCSAVDLAAEARSPSSGGERAPHDLAQHQQVRVVQPDAPGPRLRARRPAHVAIGWWQAWQSNTTSSGKSPSRLRFGIEQHVEQLRAPRAPARSPRRARRPSCPCASPSRRRSRKCGGCVCEKVSSSKLMRGWPAPIMRWVTNLSRLPKWHDRHRRALRDGSSVG